MYGDLSKIKSADGNLEVLGFPYAIPGTQRTCILRLPTDEEMLEFLSKQKTLYRDLGRGKGRAQPRTNFQPEFDLFTKILVQLARESDPPFDQYEATGAINALTQQTVDSCEPEGDDKYKVVLITMFGKTEHVLTVPSMQQRFHYTSGSYIATRLPNNIEERRFPPEPAIKLYDQLKVSSNGYKEGVNVPPNHKVSVVSELIFKLDSETPTIDIDPN